MSTIDYFRNANVFQEFEPGQAIFETGEPGDLMYAVKEGEVEIVIHDSRVIETLKAGQFFGEMALVDNAPRSATAIAKTHCKIVPVDKNRFMFLVQETPTFALQVMHVMANRLRAMNDLI